MDINSPFKITWRPAPFEEIIGLVEEIENDFLTIICSRTVRIPIGKSVLALKQIKKGSKIGVLSSDDGRVRIRLIDT